MEQKHYLAIAGTYLKIFDIETFGFYCSSFKFSNHIVPLLWARIPFVSILLLIRNKNS